MDLAGRAARAGALCRLGHQRWHPGCAKGKGLSIHRRAVCALGKLLFNLGNLKVKQKQVVFLVFGFLR